MVVVLFWFNAKEDDHDLVLKLMLLLCCRMKNENQASKQNLKECDIARGIKTKYIIERQKKKKIQRFYVQTHVMVNKPYESFLFCFLNTREYRKLQRERLDGSP